MLQQPIKLNYKQIPIGELDFFNTEPYFLKFVLSRLGLFKIDHLMYIDVDYINPYEDMPISGGKVRQMISLVEDRLVEIKNYYNNTVISGVSVDSPQAVIISTVAKKYGLDCILVYGNKSIEKLIEKRSMVENAINNATRVELCNVGYQNVLDSKVKTLCENEKPYFQIKFGINLDNNKDALVTSVANQVKNIPDDVDYIVVPCGSAIMYSGILKGLEKFNKKARVIGIQISGIDMINTVYKIVGEELASKHTFIVDKTYNYHKKLKCKIAEDFYLDPIYEAKAWDYADKFIFSNDRLKGSKFLFWVVGNSLPVREKVY